MGDLEPMEYLDAYEENISLQNDWKLIMSYNPKVIYYAHANENILHDSGLNGEKNGL